MMRMPAAITLQSVASVLVVGPPEALFNVSCEG